MRFEELLDAIGNLPYFDIQTIVQLSGESKRSVCVQLSRLSKQGKILPLRRGMYVLGKTYRKSDPNPALLANRIYAPSYLSFHWALGYYGLIPEKVVVHASATTRVPSAFENALGSFSYRHIKPDCFTGYGTVVMDGGKVLIAEPEKALLDLWHIESGEWTVDRMADMRFQGFETVSPTKLERFAAVFQSPRLMRAVRNWDEYVKSESKGTREL